MLWRNSARASSKHRPDKYTYGNNYEIVMQKKISPYIAIRGVYMFNYKIKFTKKANADGLDDEAVFEIIDDYWGALSNNGQVVGGFDIFSNGVSVFLTTVLPEADAISDVNCNDYVKERYMKLKDLFDVEIIQEGINLEWSDSCACKKSSWYYLFNDYRKEDTPLICGDCNHSVPLYKVPYILGEKEHFSVLGWQKAHSKMDGLWAHGLWDRFTYGELSKHNSKLNKEGRKICKAFEKVLDAPVYYFLYYFEHEDEAGEKHPFIPRGLQNGTPKVCPQCKSEWIDNAGYIKCEKCRLMYDSLASESN